MKKITIEDINLRNQIIFNLEKENKDLKTLLQAEYLKTSFLENQIKILKTELKLQKIK